LKHERETLEAVVAHRNTAVGANQRAAANPSDPQAMKNLMGAELALGQSLSRLMAVVEAYPDLKANESIAQLKEELASTENKVAFARQAYNDSVMVYNTARETFPNSILANSFNFQEAPLFEIAKPEEREAPKVSFG
jgi:LemA protein